MANYLTARSYSLLLKTLSSDEGAAATAFSKLRDSLVRFFELKGDIDPVNSADETLDRVSAKLGNGLLIEELTKYCFGVARLVFLENLRKVQKADNAVKAYGLEIDRQQDSEEPDNFAQMRECFGELSETNKHLLRAYFVDLPRSELDDARRKLASSIGASLNNLRLKVFRLRRQLEECARAKRFSP